MKRISVGILAVGLTAAMTSLWYQASEAAQDRDRALDVTQFLLGQFQLEPSHTGEGSEVKAREVLDQAVRKAEEATGLPEDRAAILAALGGAYLGLGIYDEAQRLLQWSLSLHRKETSAPGTDHVIVLLDLAIARRFTGDGAAARSLEAEAADMVLARQVGDLRLADHLNRRASSLNHRSACPAMAEVLYRLSLELRSRLLGSDDASLADTRHNLALALELQGKYDEAALDLGQALELRTDLHGEASMEVAKTLNAVATLLQHTSDLDRAVAAARKGLELRLRHGHPGVAKAQSTLGLVLRLQGDLDEAEIILRKAHERSADRFSADHREAASILTELASVHLSRSRPAEAEHLARRALTTFRSALPAGHWQLAEAESVLGESLLELGLADAAQPFVVRGYVDLHLDRGAGSRHAREATQRLERLAKALGKDTEETWAWKRELDRRTSPGAVCR